MGDDDLIVFFCLKMLMFGIKLDDLIEKKLKDLDRQNKTEHSFIHIISVIVL